MGYGPLLIPTSALFPPIKDPIAAHLLSGSTELQELMSSTQEAMTVLGWAGCQWNTACGLGFGQPLLPSGPAELGGIGCVCDCLLTPSWACTLAGAAPLHCCSSNVHVPSGTNIDHLVHEIKHFKPCKLILQCSKVTESPSTVHFYLPRAGSWEQQKAILVLGISAQHQSLFLGSHFCWKNQV